MIGCSKIDMPTACLTEVIWTPLGPGDRTRATVAEMAIQGTCDERFSGVREAFEMNFVERDDMIYDAGASVAVTYDGELVVDLWGGTIDTDADRNVPWERDTIINVWSTTKTVSALACLVLADSGELDFYAPVALLARVQGGRQGRDRGPPRDEPHSRLGGMVGTAARRGAVRLGAGDVDPCRPGALVAAGDGVGLPR